MSDINEWRGSCHLCGTGIYATTGTCEHCRLQLKMRPVRNNRFIRYAQTEYHDGLQGVIIGFALEDAFNDGRLSQETADALGIATGQHGCPVCGIRCWSEATARECCATLVPATDLQRFNSQIQERKWRGMK